MIDAGSDSHRYRTLRDVLLDFIESIDKFFFFDFYCYFRYRCNYRHLTKHDKTAKVDHNPTNKNNALCTFKNDNVSLLDTI